jgi:hypothetical protein
MTPHASRIVPLIAAGPRRRMVAPRERVAYELARLRAADTRDPPLRFAYLARSHD